MKQRSLIRNPTTTWVYGCESPYPSCSHATRPAVGCSHRNIAVGFLQFAMVPKSLLRFPYQQWLGTAGWRYHHGDSHPGHPRRLRAPAVPNLCPTRFWKSMAALLALPGAPCAVLHGPVAPWDAHGTGHGSNMAMIQHPSLTL